MKYTTVTINGIITQIAETTDIPGYTIGILESMLPSDEEIAIWTEEQAKTWTISNNIRMTLICKLLNDNNL